MEELNSIWNFGYGSDNDFDRKESIVKKDDFLRTVVWKFVSGITVPVVNGYGKKDDIELSTLYPFVCRLVHNGKVNPDYIYNLTGPRIKFYNPYISKNIPKCYIEKYGFVNCIPIGILDNVDDCMSYEEYTYHSISLSDIKKCIEITNCSKNILNL